MAYKVGNRALVFFVSKSSRPIEKRQEGSALIWATVVVIVLLILVGIMASVVQVSYQSQKVSQTETQAYYTAQSLNERIAGWLNNTPSDTSSGSNDQQKFIAELINDADGVIHQEYSETNLDPEGRMGSAEAIISINPEKTVITIKTTGHFAGSSATAVSTLKSTTSANFSNAPRPQTGVNAFTTSGSAFDPDADEGANYDATEDRLNGKTRDSSPEVVGWESATDNNTQNGDDQVLADLVTGDNELTYVRHLNTLNTTLGTNRYPGFAEANNSTNSKGSWRRFVTPKNGRWTINPLQAGGSTTSTTHANSAEAESNTRPIMLAIGDYEGKDLLMRLGGQKTITVSSKYELKNDSAYYNSLISFDVTDNAHNTTPNPFVEYYENNDFNNPEAHWHPQKWGSMTVFTQDTGTAADKATVNGGIDTRLVFGPFLHTYNEYGDFWSWGRYVGNPWYGQSAGDFWEAFPGNNYTSIVDKRVGMAHIPEYYGEDFSLYFNDAIDKPALIIQGVNILGSQDSPSVIYSRRSLEIGGGLVKSTAKYDDALGQTTRHVNSTISGYSYGYAPVWPSYFPTTTRYSQILYNTDIVLRTPSGTGTPRSSRIFDATLPDDGAYKTVNSSHGLQSTAANTTHLGIRGSTTTNNFSDDYNKQFSPTVRIIGGDIYVGVGQVLTIDGGRINPKNTDAGTVTFEGRTVTLGTSEGEYTQVVAPDAITVAKGGTLDIRGQAAVNGDYEAPSGYANVTAPIFVDGALNIKDGAKAEGNIVVQGNGSATMQGSTAAKGVQYNGDICIEEGGSFAVGAYAQVTGDIYVSGGSLTVSGSNAQVIGNIYTSDGGEMTIGPGAQVTGGTNVSEGGALTIDGSCTIVGDVCCVGILTINGNSFELNYVAKPELGSNGQPGDKLGDYPDTSKDESKTAVKGGMDVYIYHGIYLYENSELKITNNTLQIKGNSGGIHTFANYHGTLSHANNVFCNDHKDADDGYLCQHWTVASGMWMKQGDLRSE